MLAAGRLAVTRGWGLHADALAKDGGQKLCVVCLQGASRWARYRGKSRRRRLALWPPYLRNHLAHFFDLVLAVHASFAEQNGTTTLELTEWFLLLVIFLPSFDRHC